MSTAANQSQQPPATQPSGMDPVLLLVLGIVFVLVLGATLYLCLVHPSLTGPIGAVGGVASALVAAFAVAFSLRRR